MSRRRRTGFGLSFQDMLMAMIAVYAFLFLVAYALIKPSDEKPGVHMKAEYMLTMEWPEGNRDDIDLHLTLPDGKMVNLQSREVAYAILDHDDIGTNGVYVAADGKWTRIPEHKEVITLRAIVPGRYVANVHVYRVNADNAQWFSDPTLPFPVKVGLVKLNPQVQQLATAEIVLTRIGEQKAAFAFVVRGNGDVALERDVDVPFVPTTPFMTQS